MSSHKHKYTIADEEAVQLLLKKLLAGGPHQLRREKLLKALDQAARGYGDSNQRLRVVSPLGLRRTTATSLGKHFKELPGQGEDLGFV